MCTCIQKKLNKKVIDNKGNSKQLKKYSKYLDSIMPAQSGKCYISELALSNNRIFSGKSKSEIKFLKKIICECDNCEMDICREKYTRLCNHLKRYGNNTGIKDSYTADLMMNGVFDKLDNDRNGCITIDEFKKILMENDYNLDVLNNLKIPPLSTIEIDSSSDELV